MTADLDQIPAAIAPDSFAERLYLSLLPLTGQEQELDWPLLILCNAIGGMFQELEVVRDTPEGPGWSSVLDVNRCPADWLPWLSQFAGVQLPPGLTEAQQRAWIAGTGGFKRGTVDSLRQAAAATLTGRQKVLLYERSGDTSVVPDYAYFLRVRTYSSETPDPALTLNALLSQKPGGIVLDYAAVAGQTYSQLRAAHATYALVKSAYANYTLVAADQPG